MRGTCATMLIIAMLCGELGRAGSCLAAATPEDMIKEAQQLEKDGKVVQAVKLYEEFLRRHPDHTQVPDVNFRLAKCHDALGHPDKAIEALTKALAVEKSRFQQRTEAQYQLAKLYGSLKKYAEAVAVYEKMLNEGAGPFEIEAINTSALYYALLGKHEDAAARYNILARRREEDPKLAKSAAHKICLLWLKAEKQDMAVAAIQDYARQYPGDDALPELLLRVADLFMKAKQLNRVLAICEQLKGNFKDSPEAVAAGYLMGQIYRERKEFKLAAQTFDQTGRAAARDKRLRGLAAEALAQAAEVYYNDLHDVDSAIPRYEEAAGQARESDSERANEILQQCYFRLGEYHFSKQRWAAALDYYVMLKNLNPKVNILPRIVACQARLGIDTTQSPKATNVDRELLEQTIKANPGTVIAAEAEVFLLDSRFADAQKNRRPTAELAPEYEKLLKKYPKDVLATDHLGSYICAQMGATLAQAPVREDLVKAIRAYERALELDPTPNNPYRITALENIALIARQIDDKAKARAAEQQLFEIKKAELDANKGDKDAEMRALEYMKTLFTHSDTPELAQQSIEAAQRLIEERGPLSPLSREAKFYIGELYYIKKDFSNAAKAFREYVRAYGPPQKPDGELVNAPWRPAANDAEAQRVHEAAIRVAHAWYMQGHEQEMIRQYEWIVRNMPVNNRWLPEAQYWLAMEWSKGEKAKQPDAKKKMAEELWAKVVHPSTDFDDPKFSQNYHPWVRSGDGHTQMYVKCAILKAGELWSQMGEHELAAGAFSSYLKLFPRREGHKEKPVAHKGGRRVREHGDRDEMYEIARYALGREYLALRNYSKLIETYLPYTSGLREDRFRVSALRMLGYYAGQAERWETAIEAYATLLDEYGSNRKGADGNPLPVPVSERLRERSGRGAAGWDGIRMEPPKDLDLGEIRYALGLIYWRQEAYAHCAQTLAPFATDASLKGNKYRDRALFMAGQSYFRQGEYAKATPIFLTLIREHPRFEAIEEVYDYAARGCVEAQNWDELNLLYRKFVNEWGSKSDRRPRLDLYHAIGLVGSGSVAQGISALLNLARGDTYEDVKADAYYHLGLATLLQNPAETAKAYDYLVRSVKIYPRDTSCLEAGKLAAKLKRWEEARSYLERVGRNFPKADSSCAREAKNVLGEVLKELAKAK